MPNRRHVLAAGLSAAFASLAMAGRARAEGRHDGHAIEDVDRLEPLSDPTYRPPDPASLGGSFELVDPQGRSVTERDFAGRFMLLYFGFPGCREACPVALTLMTAALDDLGPAGDLLQPVFVDVSFDKPDPVGVGNFVANFHPRFVGLTGNRRQSFDIVRKFQIRRELIHVNTSRVETGSRLDHSAYIYLVGPDGRTRAYYSHLMPLAELVAALRRQL